MEFIGKDENLNEIPRGNSEFKSGESVYVKVYVEGMTDLEQLNDEYDVRLIVSITTYDPSGNIVNFDSDPEIMSFDNTLKSKTNRYSKEYSYSPSYNPDMHGQYKIEFQVMEFNSNVKDVKSAIFSVAP